MKNGVCIHAEQPLSKSNSAVMKGLISHLEDIAFEVIMEESFFSYSGLGRFLDHLSRQGRITPLREWDGDNGVILRHDVDFDLKAAKRMSSIEMEKDIRSTFFVLLTSRFYNPLHSENRQILRAMCKDGFEVGLHFDPTVYGDIDEEEMGCKMALEASVLSEATGVPVDSVSLHNPSVHGRYPLFKGLHNAYDPDIFSDANYISDSCMDFRGKDPFSFVERAKSNTVQVVLHPMHYSEAGGDYLDIFNGHIEGVVEDIELQFRGNKTFERLIEPGSLRSGLEKRAMSRARTCER